MSDSDIYALNTETNHPDWGRTGHSWREVQEDTAEGHVDVYECILRNLKQPGEECGAGLAPTI